MVREKNLEYFKDLVDHMEYKKAAEMYYNLSYGYRDDFNKILNESNRKNEVMKYLNETLNGWGIDKLYIEDQPEETL